MKDLLKALKQNTQKRLDLGLELKALEEEEKALSNELISQMLENGIGETKDASGAKFKMVASYNGGIAISNAEQAYKILKANGHDLHFMYTLAGTADQLKKLMDNYALGEDLYIKVGEKDDPENPIKPAVHHSTYKKWIRELDEAGKLSDEDKQILGVVKTLKVEVKLA